MAHLTIQDKYEKEQDRAEAPVGNGAPSQSATNESGATKPTDVWGQMEQDAENKYDKGLAEIEASDKLAQDTINQNTQNAVDELERGKEEKTDEYMQAQEQAYTDYKKQSDPYGVQAEQMAALGLTGSGYSATQQTALFNAYQNRVSSARIGMDKAIREYDIAIAQAKQAGDTDLAKLAVQTLSAKTQLWSSYITEMNTINLSRYEDQKTSIDWSALLGRLEGEEDLAAALRGTSTGTNGATNPTTGGGKVSTEFYQGAINPDVAEFGAFENTKDESGAAYQPKGISGHGKLFKTGDTLTLTTENLRGTESDVTQNVWEAEDGTHWIWDGAQNKYISATEYAAVQYGTFDNGYQPKGVFGHGYLKKSGATTTVNGKKQNVWIADDKTHWVWDGANKTYKPYSKTGKEAASGQPTQDELFQSTNYYKINGKNQPVFVSRIDDKMWVKDTVQDIYVEVELDPSTGSVRKKG
jgi:hypothetical protein